MIEAFPVLRQAATPVQPADCPLDDPTLRQHHKLPNVASFADFHVGLSAHTAQAQLEFWPLVSAIRIQLQQKRKQAEQSAHQHYAAIAVLDIGGMDDGAKQQALRVYQEMALLAVDFLAGIIARRVDSAPPFSALLALWLSMML